MPFKSKKQRAFMYANHPKIAKKWSNKYGNKIDSGFYGHGNVRLAGVKISMSPHSMPKLEVTNDSFYVNVSNVEGC